MRVAVALLALVFLAVALAALAPATLLDARVAAATRGAVLLADTGGTVWSGTARLADARGRWSVPIAWRTDALALLGGELAVTLLPAEGNGARGEIVLDGQAVRLANLDVAVPAAMLASAWTRGPVPQFGGSIALRAPAFRLKGARSAGALDARWERARLTVLGVTLDLGSVDAQARPAGDATRVALSNQGGEVAISGEVRVRDDGLQLDALLTPAASLPPALALLIRSLGAPAPDGAVRVVWQGRR